MGHSAYNFELLRSGPACLPRNSSRNCPFWHISYMEKNKENVRENYLLWIWSTKIDCSFTLHLGNSHFKPGYSYRPQIRWRTSNMLAWLIQFCRKSCVPELSYVLSSSSRTRAHKHTQRYTQQLQQTLRKYSKFQP